MEDTVFEKIWSAELMRRTTTTLRRWYKTPIKMSSASVCHLDSKTKRAVLSMHHAAGETLFMTNGQKHEQARQISFRLHMHRVGSSYSLRPERIDF